MKPTSSNCKICGVSKIACDCPADKNPANIIFVGDPDADVADSFIGKENIIVIQCADIQQVKRALRDGRIDFTVFGG